MKWPRSGPKKHLYFDPQNVKALILTCGGLCPGLNVVIRDIVMCLNYNYGVSEIYGAPYGYLGVYGRDWKKLVPDEIKYIH